MIINYIFLAKIRVSLATYVNMMRAGTLYVIDLNALTLIIIITTNDYKY